MNRCARPGCGQDAVGTFCSRGCANIVHAEARRGIPQQHPAVTVPRPIEPPKCQKREAPKVTGENASRACEAETRPEPPRQSLAGRMVRGPDGLIRLRAWDALRCRQEGPRCCYCGERACGDRREEFRPPPAGLAAARDEPAGPASQAPVAPAPCSAAVTARRKALARLDGLPEWLDEATVRDLTGLGHQEVRRFEDRGRLVTRAVRYYCRKSVRNLMLLYCLPQRCRSPAAIEAMAASVERDEGVITRRGPVDDKAEEVGA